MGRLLIIAIILGVVFLGGYLLGKYASGPNTGPKLTRPERKELTALRNLKSTVRSTASNHVELDPNLSRIILDEVDKTDKQLDTIHNS